MAAVNARQIKMYRSVQGKAMQKINDKATKFRDINDAVRGLDVGIKGERTIHGEATEVIKVDSNHITIEDLKDAFHKFKQGKSSGK